MTQADEARVTDKVSSALTWAAKRMRPGTEYFRLSITGPKGAACYQTLSRQLPSLTSLAKLRCIEMFGLSFRGSNGQLRSMNLCTIEVPEMQRTLEWVLQHAANRLW